MNGLWCWWHPLSKLTKINTLEVVQCYLSKIYLNRVALKNQIGRNYNNISHLYTVYHLPGSVVNNLHGLSY